MSVYYAQSGGDEQYTPARTVEILLPHIQHLRGKTIWCPFDREDSQFVRVLRANGFNTLYSHKDYGQDFFSYEPEHFDVIISNPPYSNKKAFWERCIELRKPFALLLPANILSDRVINTTMRERENSSSSFRTKGLDSTTRKMERLVDNLHSRRYISQSTCSSNKSFWRNSE